MTGRRLIVLLAGAAVSATVSQRIKREVMAPAPPRAIIPRPVSSCGVCQEPFCDDADELPCCKARVCDACAKEVVAIVTCPFCGGDPSPPPEEDCSNDAAIALALSRSWA